MSDDERRYPVQIETTEMYVVWVEADKPPEATSIILFWRLTDEGPERGRRRREG